MISLTPSARQALRTALRETLRTMLRANAAIPDYWREKLGNKRINDLTKDELLAACVALNVDVDRVISAPVAAGAPAPEAEAEAEDKAEDKAGQQDAANRAAELRRTLAMAMAMGDFAQADARIAALLAAADKPAEIKMVPGAERIVYVKEGDALPAGAMVEAMRVDVPAPISQAKWSDLFGLNGALGARRANVYAPTARTPAIDADYRWPVAVTHAALCAMIRGRNVWLYGPAGTGKSSWAEQLAARTGRPFTLIPCDDTTEAPELVGMTVPHQGGTRWQDGVLAAAIRIPHNVILIDEITVARPGALMMLQSVLQSRVLSIKETGEHIRAAEGVAFVVADNTNGKGGGLAQGYEGTQRINAATGDRFSLYLKLDYLPVEDEVAALVARSGCTLELAKILVQCAIETRKARVTHALGLRRLIAWAEALTDSVAPRLAFEYAILNGCSSDDMEPTEQCCALGLDTRALLQALKGQGGTAAPVAAGGEGEPEDEPEAEPDFV
jgi:MoxR-like ATPase